MFVVCTFVRGSEAFRKRVLVWEGWQGLDDLVWCSDFFNHWA